MLFSLNVIAVTLGSMFFIGGAVHAQSSGNITNTGPGSNNQVDITNENDCTVTNNNDVDIDNNNPQDSQSGNANNTGNTSGGGSQSGSSSNNSNTTIGGSITNNNNCTPGTTNNPGGGTGGAVAASTSATQGGFGAGASLPETSADSPLGFVGISAAVLGTIAAASKFGALAYTRIKN